MKPAHTVSKGGGVRPTQSLMQEGRGQWTISKCIETSIPHAI